jgi:hypothetical protein
VEDASTILVSLLSGVNCSSSVSIEVEAMCVSGDDGMMIVNNVLTFPRENESQFPFEST